MPKPIIFLEFNELCPALIDKWMENGELPNFKRLFDQSFVSRTIADEAESPYLEPWIQWFSIHTGKPFREHKVFHLTDGPKANHLDIWTILMRNGKRVWNCSSMNAKGFAMEGSAFLADPWCTTERAYPHELNVFHDFIGHQIREYSNSQDSSNVKMISKFMAFMLRHGLSFDTVSSTLRQLTNDLRSNGTSKWQRVAIADQLLLDLFLHYHSKLRPDFSTFFLNSTAHLQHSFWKYMDPEHFSTAPTAEERKIYGSAILYGYKKMDEILGKLLSYSSGKYRFIFATALSQQPFLKFENIGGQRFFRPHDISTLLRYVGINPTDILPVMTHQFSAKFETKEKAEQAAILLKELRVNGEEVFDCLFSEPDSLLFGCQLRTEIDSANEVILPNGKSLGQFFSLFYELELTKSGCHHPDGYLWIQTDNAPSRTSESVSILDIFPTVLKYFGISSTDSIGTPIKWQH